jgi:hypothetical protein
MIVALSLAFGALFSIRAVVELLTIDDSDPSSCASR